MQEALTLASMGEFQQAIRLLDERTQGEFGELERAIGSFISDYQIAIEQSALSIEEFNQSRRELEKKIQMIEEQRAAIQRLSAPIIDVWEGVVTVPLTGELDGARMQELAERLLARLQRYRTFWVLLDLTGAAQLDAGIAASLLRLASAIRLLGAECLLTGMGAQAAQALASLGTSLQGLRSISSLREGLKYCISRKSSAPTPSRK
jgi:rsbT co-antagonist protein RsbR